ncbi:hypothetical protein UA08_03129 [Talaromyces atroroseus]|uniref:Uncharacterized protein n=1 Tax=Talaromyces atroroseus TaxID=1441469 RepID=A0A225AJK5_TALAT|nr:hypothetical protein UA08_03129 [Talaromyces atroroseus]OKL61050.1 hypothetical protein UA08_03129 [Talaromyces atroroseus]
MASQHLYTLADQLDAFDIDFDLNKEDHTNNNDNNNNEKEKEKGSDNDHGDTNTDGGATKLLSSSLDLPASDTSFVEDSHWRWTIGWVTPSAILSCFLIAISLATAHLGLFRWLDQRRVDETITQPYVTALSLVFVNGFRMLLAAALGISFVQIVWKLLRVRPMQLGDLDKLLSVLGNPLQLGRIGLFWRVPIPFLCAVLFWCLPIAMVFPPGALTVEPKTLTRRSQTSVPIFDANYIGNGTYNGMLSAALWQVDNFGAYGSCNDSVSPALFNWVNETYEQPKGSYEYIYAASADNDALTNSQKEFVFELSWSSGGLSAGYQNLSCTAYEAVYSFQIDYRNGKQYVTTTDVQSGPLLNSSNLYTDYGMYPQDGGKDGLVNATSTGSGGGNVMDTNRRANLAAIQDTLVDAFSGYIDALIMHAQQTANTLIALSDLYSGPAKSPTFNITQDSMQGLLQNIVISMLTLNQTTSQIPVTEMFTVNVYSFSNPARLIVPYCLAIILSLGFIIGGGHALLSNGISASTGGLFQTLCTTQGSDRLGELAAKGCLGGRENVPEDLKDLKVMFGVLKNQSTRPMAGLGTEDEVIPLVKGAF